MPRVSFTQTFKSAGDVDRFPKYKLTTGEKSRGWMPEEPWMEWYHRIEAPLVENGEVMMEVKDTKRGPVEVMKMDWIGSAFCIGETGTPENPGPLMLAGIDPENCPVCESAANQTGVRPPEQRFAAPVIKYKVRGRGPKPYDLIEPTSAEILVWAYTSRQHGMLHDLMERFGSLSRLDITVEMEDTPGADKYQKIKTINVFPEPAFKDPRVREYLTELWKTHPENRPTEEQLRDACLGRDYARPVLLDMVRRAERQWRQSEQDGLGGGDSSAADGAFNGGLNEGIDALLDEHPGGGEEFMSQEQRDEIAAAKAQAQRDVAAIVSPNPLDADPFADETPTASGATTTGTSAPAAESRSRTAPKSAQSAGSSSDPLPETGMADDPAPDAAREQAVEQAADDMFGPSGNGSAQPEPAKPTNPEPAVVPAGGVIDFDDLFKD